ncbi:MAG: PLP-dependent transferase [Candidatus Micrarchaeota archaeon]|nr:PLP-dependent transferase [Candidatus Micrarchaeota archaeon]
MEKRKLGIDTDLIHAGEKPDRQTGAIAPILVRTKTYKQEFGKPSKWQYSRGQNPTRSILEEKLASLEGGGRATVYGSGLAAEAMFFMTLRPGDSVVVPDEVYGGTQRLLSKVMGNFGITFTTSDFKTEKSITSAIGKKTKYLFVEALTNPSLNAIDLSLVREVSQKRGIPYVADMTFTPPNATRAYDYGAETAIHSISKYIAGHNDVIGGVVATKDERLDSELKFLQRAVGAILSPDECYRAIQGSKTLGVRWEALSRNAKKVAEYLSGNKRITRVLYPGLESHPTHEIAKRQIKNGFGAVVSFEIESDRVNSLRHFVKEVQRKGIITYGESLASPETLLAYPATMSHGSLTEQERQRLGITRTFFRLSVGLENPEDVIAELERGLRRLG